MAEEHEHFRMTKPIYIQKTNYGCYKRKGKKAKLY